MTPQLNGGPKMSDDPKESAYRAWVHDMNVTAATWQDVFKAGYEAAEERSVVDVEGITTDLMAEFERVRGWSGSAFLAGEDGDDASSKAGLYSYLCSLGNSLMFWADQLRLANVKGGEHSTLVIDEPDLDDEPPKASQALKDFVASGTPVSRPGAAHSVDESWEPIPYPDPTPEMLRSPEFEAVWQAIKGWDIKRVESAGYAGATGNDVRHILDALPKPDEALVQARMVEVGKRSERCLPADTDCKQAAQWAALEMYNLTVRNPWFPPVEVDPLEDELHAILTEHIGSQMKSHTGTPLVWTSGPAVKAILAALRAAKAKS